MDSLAISSAVRTIGQLLTQEVTSLLGVKELVEDLQEELIWMQSFLKEADARRIADNEVVRLRVARIRELAYDAEDVIETFALKVASKRKKLGFSNTIKRSACILKEGWLLHQTKREIEKITAKITKLTQRLQTYDVKKLGDEEGSSSSNDQRHRQSRQSYPHVINDNIVGLDDDIKKLVPVLVGDQEIDYKAVAICGMGGLGKTTLAKKIHRDSKVRSHFNHFAWVYVSKQFQQRKVWEDILSDLGTKNEETRSMRDEQLAEKLCNFLKEKKCLVILDDIWTNEAWEMLEPAFPAARDKSSSKILFTSRYKGVVSGVDDRRCYQYELQCLKDKESWELFQKIAFPRRDNSTDHKPDENMENSAKEMLKHCGGLPLAIVVLGGILRERSSFRDWQLVHKNVKSQLQRGKRGGIHDVLDLSYDDLPPYLKPCFLYLSHFPEDYEIDARRLIQLWEAEGFISWNQDELNEGEVMEDVAEGYLNELAERCMIQVGKRDATLKIKSFRMHDLMRDLCLSKAKQENLLCILDSHPNLNQNGRSFSLSTLDRNARRVVSSKFLWITSIRNPRLRSVFFFADFSSIELVLENSLPCLKVLVSYAKFHKYDSCNPMMWVSKLLAWGILLDKYKGIWAHIYKNFKLARVLNFEGRTGYMGFKVPSGIGNLIYLRVLNLKDLSFPCGTLPSSLGNLKSLQTLDLRLDSVVHIPNVIWRLKQLRHLYLPKVFKCKTKLKLHTLGNLVTLVNFNMERCYVKHLFEMTNLRELEIRGHFKGDKNLLIISSKNLLSLSIWIRYDDILDPRLFAPLLSSCANIRELSVVGELGKLPDYHHFSSTIAYIQLSWCNLKEDPMPTLEKLPNLRVIKLNCEAFRGKQMVCSKQSFSKLDSLSFGRLYDLEEWKVEEGAMPGLRRLVIKWCNNLKMLPDGLRFITTLQELKIVNMPKAFEHKVMKWKDKYFKNIQPIPSIIFNNRERNE